MDRLLNRQHADARKQINDVVEDGIEKRAAVHNYRMLHDPAYRRKMSRYLKGEINTHPADEETPDQWLARVRGL